MIEQLQAISGQTFATAILLVGVFLTINWHFDHKIHLRIWQTQIPDSELRNHHMILLSSWALQACCIPLFFFPAHTIPFFLLIWVIRFIYELIDEVVWHAERCDQTETILHGGMLFGTNMGFGLTFIWGIFYNFKGLLELPVAYYVILGGILIWQAKIGFGVLTGFRNRQRTPETDHHFAPSVTST